MGGPMKKNYVLFILLGAVLCASLGAEEVLNLETYASYYGEAFNGRPTSSGEIFDMNAYTAAHRTLPFGTLLEVTNLENGKKVIVRVNDRGPFVANRELDLSKAAAKSLGMLNRGTTRVSIKKVDSLDYAALAATNDRSNRGAVSNVEKPDVQKQQVEPQNTWGSATETSETQPENHTAQKVTGISAASSDAVPENGVILPKTPEQVATGPVVQSVPAVSDEPSARELKNNTVKEPQSRWRIQLGAFTREENALRLVYQLRKAGLVPAYERAEKTVRVVLPGLRTEELDAVKKVLADNSFDDYVIRQESW